MELHQLIQSLSTPTAFPHPTGQIELRQTHMSLVFLAGPFAYKIKKPVNLGFADFSTLELRKHFCHEEVRLNRRLAPKVYLGAVPITSDGAGLSVEGRGNVVEWAVKMRRVPQEASLEYHLARGDIDADIVGRLARWLVDFYAHAESGEHVSAFARFEAVARNARENFQQTADQIGKTVSATVFRRLRELTERSLQENRQLIQNRASDNIPCDTHGDLRSEHVYLLTEARRYASGWPDEFPASRESCDHEEFAAIDCIEFAERFRFADPVSDIAFLAMDLIFHGRRDLATALIEEYFSTSQDKPGRALLPFYMAYRAAVRAKVEGIQSGQSEISEAERADAARHARAHWLLALGELECSSRRPLLVMVGGLPGTGKSTLARGLATRANLRVIRSDVVRKQLAGVSPHSSGAARFGEGIYSNEWSDRTYAECMRQAEALLFEGRRVVVDASFIREKFRRAFLELASSLAIPAVFILCQAVPEVVRQRLLNRRSDVSDADWSTYQYALDRWEEVGPGTRPFLRHVLNEGDIKTAISQSLDAIQQELLSESSSFAF